MITLSAGWHFTQNKGDGTGAWHIVRDQMVAAACNGTPRGDDATELAETSLLCSTCASYARGALRDYQPRCRQCRAPLPPEWPADLNLCEACYDRTRRRRHRQTTDSLGEGRGRTHSVAPANIRRR